MRPTDVPDQGLLCDLLWADPDKDVLGWGENDRGVSFTFGADVVAKFLHKHDMDLICRAHQVDTNRRPRGRDLHVRAVFTLSFLSWGGRGWLRVFRQEAAGHSVLRSQLLRRVWQRWCHDERGRDAHVLLPGMYLCRKALIIPRFKIAFCLDFLSIIVKIKSWKYTFIKRFRSEHLYRPLVAECSKRIIRFSLFWMIYKVLTLTQRWILFSLSEVCFWICLSTDSEASR